MTIKKHVHSTDSDRELPIQHDLEDERVHTENWPDNVLEHIARQTKPRPIQLVITVPQNKVSTNRLKKLQRKSSVGSP